MLNKDSVYFGILLGALLPFGFLAVFYLLIFLIIQVSGIQPFLSLNSLILLSIAPNFLIIRYFFNKKHLEHTGSGILIISVGYVFLFFLFVHGTRLIHLPGLIW